MKIIISKPFRNGRLNWTCHFRITGIPKEIEAFEIYGSDSLQALVLSLYYLRSSLARLQKKGYLLLHADSDEPIAPNVYFDASGRKA